MLHFLFPVSVVFLWLCHSSIYKPDMVTTAIFNCFLCLCRDDDISRNGVVFTKIFLETKKAKLFLKICNSMWTRPKVTYGTCLHTNGVGGGEKNLKGFSKEIFKNYFLGVSI